MINLRLTVRRAVVQDRRQISALIFKESHTHCHLDWRPALEWIGVQNFWALEEYGMIAAVLACPEDPPGVAWIRLFAHHAHLSGPEAWSALWSVARADMSFSNPGVQTAGIAMKPWFQSLLRNDGFEPCHNIVLLELREGNYVPPRALPGARIRPMTEDDLCDVESVDREAFGGFWHNSFDSLRRARAQSAAATVAEDANGILGYQISAGNPYGTHLARLGVRPEAQGRGVASALVDDLIQRTGGLRSGRLSVNTQENNLASLQFYQKLGFAPTGEHYPVFVQPMRGAQ